MKPRPDLNSLAKEVYETNKLKGFHDKEQSNETLLMLVITELSKAVEADRKGKRALMKDFNEDVSVKEIYFKQAFETYIKDTIEDELADSVIRLLDLAGLRGVAIETKETNVALSCDCSNGETFPESIYHISRTVIMRLDPNNERLGDVISLSIAEIEGLCEHLSIDLWLHVELKLKYNQLRPYKHEKEY